MEKKYLPIGSVCTIKGQTKKIMITGYYSVEYNGNLKIKDYSGCFYPEGMLLPNSVLSFNHSEIEKVDFVGFKNEENEKFHNSLNQLTGNAETEEPVAATATTYSRIVFDENGVVTLVEPIEPPVAEEPVAAAKVEEVVNPFFKEYKDEPVSEKKSDLKYSKIKFDENGFVVAVDEISEEEKKDFLNDIQVEEKTLEPTPEKTTLGTIEFDENGNIVGV